MRASSGGEGERGQTRAGRTRLADGPRLRESPVRYPAPLLPRGRRPQLAGIHPDKAARRLFGLKWEAGSTLFAVGRSAGSRDLALSGTAVLPAAPRGRDRQMVRFSDEPVGGFVPGGPAAAPGCPGAPAAARPAAGSRRRRKEGDWGQAGHGGQRRGERRRAEAGIPRRVPVGRYRPVLHGDEADGGARPARIRRPGGVLVLYRLLADKVAVGVRPCPVHVPPCSGSANGKRLRHGGQPATAAGQLAGINAGASTC